MAHEMVHERMLMGMLNTVKGALLTGNPGPGLLGNLLPKPAMPATPAAPPPPPMFNSPTGIEGTNKANQSGFGSTIATSAAGVASQAQTTNKSLLGG